MKNQVWLIRDVQVAQDTARRLREQGISFATVEAEYGEISIEGSHATLSHHTSAYRHCKAPCIRTDVQCLENGIILISHLDLDTLGGISLLEGRYLNHSFWDSEAIIDTQGVLGHTKIPDTDSELMKVYWAWEQTLIESPRTGNIVQVTQQVLTRLSFIEDLLSERLSFELKTQYLKQFEIQLSSFFQDCVWDTPTLRVFISSKAQHYLTHYSEQGLVECCITLNTEKGTLILSDVSETLDCKELMQELFGPKAGGQFRVAGTPRDENFGGIALIYLIESLLKLKNWNLHPFNVDSKHLFL